MTTTLESRLLCDHCHGHGYEDTAAGKVACGECNPAPAHLGWISVKDRMPDPARTGWHAVLVGDPDGIGWRTDIWWRARWFPHGSDQPAACWSDAPPVDDGQPVTHWMELPPLPSEISTGQQSSEVVSNHQEISCLSHGQPLLNILHREEDCSTFRKLVRVLDGNFAQAANPFPAAADHIASAPATITDWDGKRRNCVVTERYDLQHFGLRSLGIGKEFLLLVINQHGKALVRLHQTWCDWEMTGEQG